MIGGSYSHRCVIDVSNHQLGALIIIDMGYMVLYFYVPAVLTEDEMTALLDT